MNEPGEQQLLNPFQSPDGTNPAIEIQPEVIRGPNSTWPSVLGIVGIAFGIFGAMGGIAGFAMNLLFVFDGFWFSEFMDMDGPQSMEVAAKYAVLNLVLSAASTLVALWLLGAGIMILQRRPACRIVTISWAMAKSMLVIVLNVAQLFVQRDTVASIQDVMPVPLEMMEPIFWAILILGALFNLAWGLALPVVYLYWFSRAQTKAEMATWK